MAENFRGSLTQLSTWCVDQYRQALEAQMEFRQSIAEYQRLYDARPQQVMRIFPWPGASNLEVPVGATHVDTVYGQINDAYFGTQPIAIVKYFQSHWQPHAHALQEWLNQVELPKANFKKARQESLLSTVKFGSGYNFLTWERQFKRVRRNRKVVDVSLHDGPMVHFIPIQDIVRPFGLKSIERGSWIGYRRFSNWNDLITDFYSGHYSRGALQDIANEGQFYYSRYGSNYTDQQLDVNVKNVGRVQLWEIVTMFCYYQTAKMAMPEDLWITFHYPSGKILDAIYNPFNHLQRPLHKTDYMFLEGQFEGLGIIGMLEMIQKEVTDVHNHRMNNMYIVNTRYIKGKRNAVKDMEIYPMKFIEITGDVDDVKFDQAGEIYPSSIQAETAGLAYGERRTGVGDSNMPRLSAFQGAAGVRTPATTTLALLGQGNKRFGVSIDNGKVADANLLHQLVMLDKQFWMLRREAAYAWNSKNARLLDELFSESDANFRSMVTIEISASTTMLNREVEKNNVTIIANFIRGFYNDIINLAALAAQNPSIQPLANEAFKAAVAFSKLLLETFDVRDPEQYLPRLEAEISRDNNQQPAGFDAFANAIIGTTQGRNNGGTTASLSQRELGSSKRTNP